jgi:hypothetical protein
MRDWNLPRPLVRWLDALYQDGQPADSLYAEVLRHTEELESRSQALRPLLAGFTESTELWETYQNAMASYRAALEGEPPQPEVVLSAVVALEEAVLALRELAAELPRVTGHGVLDEIFAVGMSLAHGAELEPEALLHRLVGGRETVLRLQSQRALFARTFPQEEEIVGHLDDAVEALEEALGGAFLYLAEEPDRHILEQAMRTLASGGMAAMAALAAIREVSEADHRFSEDPVLEELFRAVEAGDPERVEVALVDLDASHATLEQELEGLFSTFAPQSWRERHLEPLQRHWIALEQQRVELHQAAAESRLSLAQLEAFQNLASQLDELENEAAESLPGRASLPDVAHLVSLVELMGAVFEERAPLVLLEEEFERLVASYRDYQAHLERVYEGQVDQEHPDLEELVQAAEELGEALSMLETAMEERDVGAFPAVWDALAEPAAQLHRLAHSASLEGFTAPPEVPLPLFFAELRELWRDRLARRLGPGEYMQALRRAEQKLQQLAGQVKQGAETGPPEVASFKQLVGQLASLLGRGMAGPDYDDLETIEALGLQWQQLLPDQLAEA